MEQPAAFGPRPHVSFEVEKILGISSDGNYQVQWAPAWVSKFHLVGCEHLIQDFLLEQAETFVEPENYLEPSVGLANDASTHESKWQTFTRNNASYKPQECDDQTVVQNKLNLSLEKDLGAVSFCPGDITGVSGTRCDDAIAINIKEEDEEKEEDNAAAISEPHYPYSYSTESLLIDRQPNRASSPATHLLTEIKHDADGLVNEMDLNTEDSVAEITNNSEWNPMFLGTVVSSDSEIEDQSFPSINRSPNEFHVLENGNQPAHETIKDTYSVTCGGVSYEISTAETTVNQQTVSALPPHTVEELTPSDALHKCTYCSKAFTQRHLLNRHLRTHNPEKPFSCPQCSYRCAVKCNLTSHMSTHTQERYVCDLCEKSFSRNSYLKKHKRLYCSREKVQV